MLDKGIQSMDEREHAKYPHCATVFQLTEVQSMIVRIAISLVVLLLGTSQATKVTVDDLMKLRFIADVSLSPDGQRVAYVVSTPDIERGEHLPVLYLVPANGGKATRLTYSTRIFNQPLPQPRLRWSPDGSMLSFIGWVGDKPQVLAMSSSGGEFFPLTTAEDGVALYEWSPDGKRIAFVAPDPLAPEILEKKKKKSYVIHVDREDRPPRLWVQDVEGGTPKPLSSREQVVVDFAWSPDGSTICYSASQRKGFYAKYNTKLYTVPSSGGKASAFLDRAGTNRTPAYSPDGKWIAFISTGGYEGMIAAQDLYIIAADGRRESIRNLTREREAWIGEFVWSHDGRSIFYITTEETQSGAHMFEQPINRVWLDSGKIENLTPGRVVNYSVTLSKDGSRIAYRSVKPRTMGDVAVMELPGEKPRFITEVNPQLRNFELGNLEPISWKSFDGKEIWGLLLTPPGYRPGTRIPLVVYCHGGPIGGYTYGIFPQFMHIPGQVDPYPVEAMASAGMAILLPMPRGGSGYGTAGFREIVGSWGEKDYKDIMAGVDHVIEMGIADPERLGVMGASYGGFMTSWIVTHTDRFRAASTACSVNDLMQLYYLSDAGEVLVEYFGLPWEAAESLIQHSPIAFVRNITTPLLIQHGENDLRVPVAQAWILYRAMKALNKTVEFDLYPRGGHVNFEPPLEREYMRRNLEWFARWLINR